jgi:hypothetical protein
MQVTFPTKTLLSPAKIKAIHLRRVAQPDTTGDAVLDWPVLSAPVVLDTNRYRTLQVATATAQVASTDQSFVPEYTWPGWNS